MTKGNNGNEPIREVTIVGGGTAGWMTAALLSHSLRRDKYKIRLVESNEIGTIGVGEATLPAIRIFNEMAAINQNEMFRETKATFKLGIQFVNWEDVGSSYIHGFGKIGHDKFWLHTHHFWLKYAAQGKASHFDNYSVNCAAALKNKCALPDLTQPGSPLADIDFAYHFDASLYAVYLRNIAEQRGLERIEGKIADVRLRSDDGHIEQLILEDGRTVGGDLFIDCSGMRGLLIGGAMDIGYEDWNHWLLCDRALAVPCENAPALTPYTRSTAHGAGWQWRIPLQHRIGNGHVYSSAHTTDEAAAEVLLSNLDGKAIKDPMPVRFRPGRRLKAWDKNVVAIGLSSGFLEPLESTSIHMIQTGILRLLALFPSSKFNEADIAEYNRQSEFEMVDIRDFIIAHYKVTNREDTPFWSYCKNMDIPDSLAARLELFRSSGRFFQLSSKELFREESWVQVLIGQGLNMRYDPLADMVPDQEALGYLQDIKRVMAACADHMPSHQDLVDRVVAAGRPKAPFVQTTINMPTGGFVTSNKSR